MRQEIVSRRTRSTRQKTKNTKITEEDKPELTEDEDMEQEVPVRRTRATRQKAEKNNVKKKSKKMSKNEEASEISTKNTTDCVEQEVPVPRRGRQKKKKSDILTAPVHTPRRSRRRH